MGMTIFRQRLAEAIAKSGKSPDTIAAEAKISHYAIYSWLRGNCRTPNMVTLSSVADVLGVSLDWLWGRDRR